MSNVVRWGKKSAAILQLFLLGIVYVAGLSLKTVWYSVSRGVNRVVGSSERQGDDFDSPRVKASPTDD